MKNSFLGKTAMRDGAA